MFNYGVQVKKLKKDTNGEPKSDQTEKQLEGKVAIIGYYLEHAVEKVGKAVIAYVIVDTIRQVMVAKASR